MNNSTVWEISTGAVVRLVPFHRLLSLLSAHLARCHYTTRRFRTKHDERGERYVKMLRGENEVDL